MYSCMNRFMKNFHIHPPNKSLDSGINERMWHVTFITTWQKYYYNCGEHAYLEISEKCIKKWSIGFRALVDLDGGLRGLQPPPPLILYIKKTTEREWERERGGGVELAQLFPHIVHSYVYVHSSIWRCTSVLSLELKLAYFKNGFSTRNKAETNSIPEADYNSLVDFYDNLQQELKKRALRSYPDLKNIDTDEFGMCVKYYKMTLVKTRGQLNFKERATVYTIVRQYFCQV